MHINSPSVSGSLSHSINHIYQLSLIHSERITLFYLFTLFSMLAAYMFTYPIIISDTDLWYHLNGGRYFWETGSISSSAFFSFIEPEKYRTNYFWGFQAAIFKIYDLTGYYGLLFIKSILVMTSAYFISRIITGNIKIRHTHVFQLLLIALVIYLISLRGNIVRPHLISYAMIPAFIYILLHNRKHIYILPFLTVIWVNFHGVEWPVGALICGSFFLQYLYDFKTHGDKRKLKDALWVALCIPAIFINPYGYKILLAPFILDPDTYLFIGELKETTIFTSSFLTDQPFLSQRGIIFILFCINIYTIIVLWLKNRLTISKALLSIGAILLLFKGQRFIWEWILLSTPVFWSACIHIYRDNPIKQKHVVSSSLITLTLLSPIALWSSEFNSYNHHPYDYTNSPTPTTDFIKHIGLKNARYMAPPSLAGYIQWELHPNTLVHSDMEFPPFDGLDYFEYLKSITTRNGLEHIRKKYNPDYLGVPSHIHTFHKLSQESNLFVPIFMDDHIVLYINKELHPEIADKHQLKHINPYTPLQNISEENIASQISEIEKIVRFSEFSQDNLVTLISYLITNKQYESALKYTKLLKNRYRNNPNTLFLQGQIYENLNDYQRAIDTYNQALEEPETSLTNTIHSYLADSYYQTENYRMAYKHHKKSFNPYQKKESLKRYFSFGYSAVVVGDLRRGRRLFRQMLMLSDDENIDIEITNNARELIRRIDDGEFSSSIFNL